jgi:hypothetical protein
MTRKDLSDIIAVHLYHHKWNSRPTELVQRDIDADIDKYLRAAARKRQKAGRKVVKL